jgi:glycosidase
LSGVTYEIFVHSFADSDGDGIGDFEGLTAKLDMVDALGAEAIWLMPIHPSPSYHKYDVTDYRAIHPDYGTMADFERFLAEAHERGIRVIMDFVINHTARAHPWFQRAVQNPSGPYHDFYVWADPDTLSSTTVEETGPDTGNLKRWHEAEGLDERYYGYFWGGMPDLNFDNPAVRDSIINIGQFWLEKGVDGFRLDAARHIYNTPTKNHRFWDQFRAKMEAIDPNVFLVGEVWADTDAVTPYLSGLHSVFNFDMAQALLDAAATGRADSLAYRHAEIRTAYQKVAPNFVDATFLANHDQNRVRSVLDSDAEARVAARLLFTLPGRPFVYYGEEIGMRGKKPDPHIREPYLWTSPPDSVRADWIEPEYSTDSTVTPLRMQRQRDGSLWHLYQRLIALRNEHPALHDGELRPVASSDTSVALFVRTHADGDLLVAHNVGEDEVQTVLPDSLRAFDQSIYRSTSAVQRQSETLVLPARSTVILRR